MRDINQTNQLEHNNCEGCYWFNQCKQAILCEDFTTITAAENVHVCDEQIYQESLDERMDDYYITISEMEGVQNEINF